MDALQLPFARSRSLVRQAHVSGLKGRTYRSYFHNKTCLYLSNSVFIVFIHNHVFVRVAYRHRHVSCRRVGSVALTFCLQPALFTSRWNKSPPNDVKHRSSLKSRVSVLQVSPILSTILDDRNLIVLAVDDTFDTDTDSYMLLDSEKTPTVEASPESPALDSSPEIEAEITKILNTLSAYRANRSLSLTWDSALEFVSIFEPFFELVGSHCSNGLSHSSLHSCRGVIRTLRTIWKLEHNSTLNSSLRLRALTLSHRHSVTWHQLDHSHPKSKLENLND